MEGRKRKALNESPASNSQYSQKFKKARSGASHNTHVTKHFEPNKSSSSQIGALSGNQTKLSRSFDAHPLLVEMQDLNSNEIPSASWAPSTTNKQPNDAKIESIKPKLFETHSQDMNPSVGSAIFAQQSRALPLRTSSQNFGVPHNTERHENSGRYNRTVLTDSLDHNVSSRKYRNINNTEAEITSGHLGNDLPRGIPLKSTYVPTAAKRNSTFARKEELCSAHNSTQNNLMVDRFANRGQHAIASSESPDLEKLSHALVAEQRASLLPQIMAIVQFRLLHSLPLTQAPEYSPELLARLLRGGSLGSNALIDDGALERMGTSRPALQQILLERRNEYATALRNSVDSMTAPHLVDKSQRLREKIHFLETGQVRETNNVTKARQNLHHIEMLLSGLDSAALAVPPGVMDKDIKFSNGTQFLFLTKDQATAGEWVPVGSAASDQVRKSKKRINHEPRRSLRLQNKEVSSHDIGTASNKESLSPWASQLRNSSHYLPPAPGNTYMPGAFKSAFQPGSHGIWYPPPMPYAAPGAAFHSSSAQSFASPGALPATGRWLRTPPPLERAERRISVPAPTPSQEYLDTSAIKSHRSQATHPLLIICDLNGTLVHRKNRGSKFLTRPGVKFFLDYLSNEHTIMVWTSAQPYTMNGIVNKTFTASQKAACIKLWSRETLGLTQREYSARIQVYKRLEKVWNDEEIQQSHPHYVNGGRWSQLNTMLIDDSPLKSAAQPFNAITVPEFTLETAEEEVYSCLLEQVQYYIEGARHHDNISNFMRDQPFVADGKHRRGKSRKALSKQAERGQWHEITKKMKDVKIDNEVK